MKKTEKNLRNQLNMLLASEITFTMTIRNAHWNLLSFHFVPIHNWLGSIYEEFNNAVDEIAERNRMIGGFAESSFKTIQSNSKIKDYEGILSNEDKIYKKLTQDNQSLISEIKLIIETADGLGDSGTEDFLTGLLRQHEKLNWTLTSFEPKK